MPVQLNLWQSQNVAFKIAQNQYKHIKEKKDENSVAWVSAFTKLVRINRNKAGITLKAPTATYRVQLNKTFDFHDLKSIVPYLSQLGISHIYASPIFQAKKGSMHGYDVTDPTIISEELGGRAGLKTS